MPENPKSVKMFNELGKTGLTHYQGILFEEFLPQLQGSRAVKTYTEMANNSAIVGAMLFAVDSLLRSVSWDVEPYSDSNEDLQAAQFLEECRHDMSHTFEDFISEVLSMLPYGWSYFEQVYKTRQGPDQKTPSKRSRYNDGRVGWRKFAIRAQNTLHRWRFDKEGGISGMEQQVLTGEGISDGPVFIPINKSLLFRTTSTKNSPEGRSILRNAYRSYYLAKRIEETEAIGLERDLAGMPVAWVPLEVLADDKTGDAQATFDAIKDIVTRVKRDEQEGLILPLAYDDDGNKLYDFELMNSGGQRQFDTGSIIQRYTQQIAMTILADFILLGHEKVGSFALSSDKTELFAVAMGSWLDMIEATLNRHAVTRLFELNTFNIAPEKLPAFRHGDIEKPDLTELAAYVSQLSSAGVALFPDYTLENYLLGAADLPERDPEDHEKVREEKMKMAEKAQMARAPSPNGQQRQQQRQQGNGKTASDIQKRVYGTEEVLEKSEDGSQDEIPLAPPRAGGATSALRPSYFNGSKWVSLKGRHRWR